MFVAPDGRTRLGEILEERRKTVAVLSMDEGIGESQLLVKDGPVSLLPEDGIFEFPAHPPHFPPSYGAVVPIHHFIVRYCIKYLIL